MSSDEQDGEKALLLDLAAELLALDGEVIDIFANLTLAPMAESLEDTDYGYTVSGTYYRLAEDCPYSSFDSITALLASAYSSDSGVAEEYLLNWPRVGNPVFRCGEDGRAELCYVYNAGFDTDFSSGEITYLGTSNGNHRFQYSKLDSIYSFEITEEDGEYRLTDSLLFIDEDIRLAYNEKALAVEDSGSARKLRGDCLWVNVFVNDGVSSWTEADRSSVISMVDESVEYIMYNANAYGISDLNIQTMFVGFDTDEVLDAESAMGNWAVEGFKRLSWGSVGAFALEVLEDKECDEYCLMFHFNRYGRSFSVPCDVAADKAGDYFTETSVLFFGDISEGEYFACSAVYAHEFLHAFGAVDLYDEVLSEKGNALAELYFSDDIMRYEPTDIYKSRVDALTAKLIGWTEGMPLQLTAFLKELRN